MKKKCFRENLNVCYLGHKIAFRIRQNDALVNKKEELYEHETSKIVRTKIKQQLVGKGRLHLDRFKEKVTQTKINLSLILSIKNLSSTSLYCSSA